jgi:peptidoglycan/xylan/chitin deacetylase (PgdA/CDA1 family)
MSGGFGRALRRTGSFLPSGLTRGFSRPVVLFFHGVEQRIDDSRVQSNHHDFASFSQIAGFLKDNFDVLPLSMLDEVLSAPGRHRRSVFLAADDGYANNLSVAQNILQELNLPWTLFLSTGHVDTAERNPMFVARLFFLFAPSAKYDIASLCAHLVLSDGENRAAAADLWVGRLKALDAGRAQAALDSMRAQFEGLDALAGRYASDAFLTWPEVAALKADGVEIGAHAHWHWPMHAAQSPDYLGEQARLSRARIEAEIGPCRYFAYPFGNTQDIGRDAWRAVRDAGYDYAFTTLSGSLDASTNRWLMPRYGLALREPRLPALVPWLRAGNGRLRAWQRQMAG